MRNLQTDSAHRRPSDPEFYIPRLHELLLVSFCLLVRSIVDRVLVRITLPVYNKVFKDYINGSVSPCLQGKKGEALVEETERRWSDHKVMTRWLIRFFHYLDRYFVPKRNVPPLQESALLCFYDLLFGEFSDQTRDAVLSLIDREREGEDIDRVLVKNIVSIYVDVGQG
ncbi:hypothetical protein GQ457_13G026730 [Hibiscus cannabinus]